MTKKKYYPNNWQAYKEADPSWFLPLDFNEFMEWKMAGWELPSSVACIIRESNIKTGKVTEHVYSRMDYANKRARKIMKEGKSEFIVCTHDDLGHIFPNTLHKEDSIYEHYDDERDWFDDKLREEQDE